LPTRKMWITLQGFSSFIPLLFNICSCLCTRYKVRYTTTSFKLMFPSNNRVMWCNRAMLRNFQTEAAHSAMTGQRRSEVLYSVDPLSLKRLTNCVTLSLSQCAADATPYSLPRIKIHSQMCLWAQRHQAQWP
jgi:hypothetical protein